MDLDFARNQKYFNDKYDKLFLCGFVIGVIVIFAEGLIAGLVVIAITIVLWFVVAKGKPSDNEIDQQLQNVVDQLRGIAMNKHGLTEDQASKAEPLVLGGYMSELLGDNVKNIVKGVAGALGGEVGNMLADVGITAIEDGTISGIKYKKGRDGIIRSSAAEFTIFLFSENQVFIYTMEFSLIGPETKESSQEYFYRDIVSISTERSKSGSHVFTIKVSSGDSEKIPYGRETPDIQQTITAFRQLIRDKKNA